MSREFLFCVSVFVGGAIVLLASWEWLREPIAVSELLIR